MSNGTSTYWASLPTASTSQAGIVQLTSSYNDTSVTLVPNQYCINYLKNYLEFNNNNTSFDLNSNISNSYIVGQVSIRQLNNIRIISCSFQAVKNLSTTDVLYTIDASHRPGKTIESSQTIYRLPNNSGYDFPIYPYAMVLDTNGNIRQAIATSLLKDAKFTGLFIYAKT